MPISPQSIHNSGETLTDSAIDDRDKREETKSPVLNPPSITISGPRSNLLKEVI